MQHQLRQRLLGLRYIMIEMLTVAVALVLLWELLDPQVKNDD